MCFSLVLISILLFFFYCGLKYVSNKSVSNKLKSHIRRTAIVQKSGKEQLKRWVFRRLQKTRRKLQMHHTVLSMKLRKGTRTTFPSAD